MHASLCFPLHSARCSRISIAFTVIVCRSIRLSNMLRSIQSFARSSSRSVAQSARRSTLLVCFSSSTSPSSSAAPTAGPVRVVHSLVHNPFFNIALESRMLTKIVEASTAATADSAAATAAPSASAAAAVTSPPPFASAAVPASILPSPPASHTLFLWSNAPCVILGKHQNPHREVRLDALRARDVALVRRQSGGGAVYQDLGNAIFSFISRDTTEQKEQHNAILLRALASLGVDARLSGRNDLETAPSSRTTTAGETVGGRKISGCAFKREKGWLLHHGTMLISVDMAALPALLSPSKAKLRAKGVESVAARVINLQQIIPTLTTDRWNSALEAAFKSFHAEQAAKAGLAAPSIETEYISDESAALSSDPSLQSAFDLLRSWDWIHGSTPEFSHDFSRRFEGWGSVDVGFKVARGSKIEDAKCFSDALVPAMIDRINEQLSAIVGKMYTREIVADAMEKAAVACAQTINEEAAANVREMKEWLRTQM